MTDTHECLTESMAALSRRRSCGQDQLRTQLALVNTATCTYRYYYEFCDFEERVQ